MNKKTDGFEFKFHFLISELVEHLLSRQDKTKVLELFKRKPKLKKEFIDMIYDHTHDFITDWLGDMNCMKNFGNKLQKEYDKEKHND